MSRRSWRCSPSIYKEALAAIVNPLQRCSCDPLIDIHCCWAWSWRPAVIIKRQKWHPLLSRTYLSCENTFQAFCSTSINRSLSFVVYYFSQVQVLVSRLWCPRTICNWRFYQVFFFFGLECALWDHEEREIDRFSDRPVLTINFTVRNRRMILHYCTPRIPNNSDCGTRTHDAICEFVTTVSTNVLFTW